MTNKKIKWAANIPLIGGFPIAVEQELGTFPEYVCSYTGFWDNDRLYMNWLNNINKQNIPYHNLTEIFPPKVKHVDLVVATPPLTAAA